MLNYKKGDLLQATEDIIAHGCNTVGGFGSGVAGQIAIKYPEAREAYLRNFKEFQLGDIQLITKYTKIIVNCATQRDYLPRDVCHADYEAIRLAMTKVKEFGRRRGLSVAIPKIGAGLAGGDWNTIEAILQDVFKDHDVTVYEL